MGIPKFFRFMSERYPLISQLVEENKIPEFDNLYLDMNGIIHHCSHPNDGDAHFRITEEQIFLAIFSYIEHLFAKIKPKKFFFLAVDGVAPRAKMNQQRSRRFRTAKEAKDLREKAERRGEDLPKEAAFDSNCITPGTPFMARLSEQLKYFINKKVSEDSNWREVEVVLSGHDVPGEGEHKIMEYIRLAKAQPDYNPNVRHCLYGLDADLIMLGLLSHDPHFCLLREEVTFGPARKKAKQGFDKQSFYLLHLSLLREYLDAEFAALAAPGALSFPYDLERIIDDFILISIFIGNDFLPHLPNLHVNEGGLDLLFGIYKRVMPKTDGYLNERGVLNVRRLALILEELTKFERDEFEKESADTNWLKAKQARFSKPANGRSRKELVLTPTQKQHFEQVKAFVLSQSRARTSTLRFPNTYPARDRRFLQDLADQLRLQIAFNEYDPAEDETFIELTSNLSLISNGNSSDSEGGGNQEREDDSEWEDVDAKESEEAIKRVLSKYENAKVEDMPSEEEIEEEHKRRVDEKIVEWKKDYYKGKMGIDYNNEEEMHKLSYRYVEGLQWVLHYYYDGVASWGWFYDYHYAPKISDLRNVAKMTFDFELGKPFRPFEQLMSVLPEASSQLIPMAFRDLMSDPNSPIIDFYPQTFEQDLNGKKQDWEAVIKIPFIDEQRLLNTLRARSGLLSKDEQFRNSYGTSTRFMHDPESDHIYPSSLPGVFPDIVHCQSSMEPFDLPTLSGLHLVKGLCEGVLLGSDALAGFPTMKTLPHFATLVFHGVNVFQSESKRETIVLTITNDKYDNVKMEDVAKETIGKRTFTNWPFLREGLVVAVSDNLFRYEQTQVAGVSKIVNIPHRPETVNSLKRKTESIERLYSKRFGVIIGSVEVILHVRPLKGLKRLDDGSLVKDYENNPNNEIEQPLQLAVFDVSSEDKRYLEKAALSLREEYPEKTRVFFLGHNAYGTPTQVVANTDHSLAIEVAFFPNQARENNAIRQVVLHRARENYFPSYIISKRVGLSGLALSKITSSMMIMHGDHKLNFGLNLKFEAKGQKVLGYSRKSESGWEFSDKAVELIQEYKQSFPEIVDALARNYKDITRAIDLFGKDVVDKRVEEVKAWIKEKGVRDLDTVPLFAEQLDRTTIQQVEELTNRISSNKMAQQIKRVFIKGIPRTALLKPEHAKFRLQNQAFALGDRVIIVEDSGNVPLSAKGVVIGINSTSIDIVLDVPFLGGTTLGDRTSPYRGATVGFSAVLNLSNPQYAACTTPPPAYNHLQAATANPPAPARGGFQGRGRGNTYRPPNFFTPAAGRGRGVPPMIAHPAVVKPARAPPVANRNFAAAAHGRGRHAPAVDGPANHQVQLAATINQGQTPRPPRPAAAGHMPAPGWGRGGIRGGRGGYVGRGGGDA